MSTTVPDTFSHSAGDAKMRRQNGQISLRQTMIIIALMAFISAMAVSYLQFHDAYSNGIIDQQTDGLSDKPRPVRRNLPRLNAIPQFLVDSGSASPSFTAMDPVLPNLL
jgi:hypothetical protein